jgi:hypothetical protein
MEAELERDEWWRRKTALREQHEYSNHQHNRNNDTNPLRRIVQLESGEIIVMGRVVSDNEEFVLQSPRIFGR